MGRRKLPVHSTPEGEAAARAFMEFVGANADSLRHYVRGGSLGYDEDLFADAILRARDAIVRRGAEVRSPTGYFLRAYRAAALDRRRRRAPAREDDRPLEKMPAVEPVADVQFEFKRRAVEYVRENYDEAAVSLFEMYLGGFPEMSYKRLSRLTGLPVSRIWPVLGKIRRALARRRNFLLSD